MVNSITNKKWKHFADDDGNFYKKAVVDGYQYGDKLLEGVMFELTIEDTGLLSIKVEDSAKDYFSQFNEKHWYDTILESVEKECEAMIKVGKHSYEDVLLIEDDATCNTTTHAKVVPQPIIVKKITPQEIVDRLKAKTNSTPVVEKEEESDEDEFKNYFNKDNEMIEEESDEVYNYDCIKTLAEAFASVSSSTGDKAYKEMALNATEEIFGERKLYPTRKNITDAKVTEYIKNLKAQLEQIDNMYTATMDMWNDLFANGTVQSPNGKAPQIIMDNQPLQRNPLVLKLKELLDGLLNDIENGESEKTENTSTVVPTSNDPNKINFLHFKDKNDNTVKVAYIDMGMLYGEQFDDCTLKAEIVNGDIVLSALDFNNGDHEELNDFISKNPMKWENGYEFVEFNSDDDFNGDKLTVIGDKPSDVFNMVNSSQNMNNINNVMNAINGNTSPTQSNIPNNTSLNSAIQNLNNGKTNITANPATSDLGLADDKVDPDYVIYSQKLDNLHTTIKEKASEKEEELKSLNKVIDRNTYWEVYYNLELYNAILNKFFDKEYLTHPKIRFAKVKTFLEEVTYKFTPYLESISYKIKTEEDIEAYEKEYLAKNLLTELFLSEKKKITTVTEKVDLKELGNNISDEKKSKLSDFLRKVEAGNDFEQEKENTSKKELTEYEKANLKGKIALKYQEVLKRAIELDNEEDGLIKTYVETLYNPATTSLDDKNLLLNLLIVSRMQDFGVMKWDFDEKRVKVSNTETDLKHDWWSKILKEDIEEDLKYTKIVEKELNLAFYTSFISSLLKNADKLSYGERNLKFKKILSDGNDDTSRETLLLDTILKKTHSGSILFITPDMEKWVLTENSVDEELGDKGQVKYKGVWNERHIFVINIDKIRGLEQYSNEIIFVNQGNSYVLNPEKPIVYYNVIENPFLERPILKWFAGAEFDISMDKATRMRVDNTFLE